MIDRHEAELRSLLRGEVEFDPINRALFSTAACIFRIVPLGVAAPRSTGDVRTLVRYARDRRIPLTPRAGGSSLAGNSIGEGIVIDFKRHMNRILEVNRDEGWARVEPGVIYAELNAHLKRHGSFFAPDPSSGNFCCLGGMVGNNGAGPHTLKYGATKDHVLALSLVTGAGDEVTLRPLDMTQEGTSYASPEEEALHHRLWKLLSLHRERLSVARPRYTKNSSGYNVREVLRGNTFDPTRLLVGSEGTLGVVTGMTVRILPLPPAKAAALFYFSHWALLGEAVSAIVADGASAAEVMDRTFLALVRRGSPHLAHLIPDDAEAALLVEFEGESTAEAEERLRQSAAGLVERAKLAREVRHATLPAEQAELWELRKAAYPLLYKADLRRKPMNVIDDAALPLDQIDRYLDGLRKLFARRGLDAVIYGHAGNGNLHVNPLMDPHDPRFPETLAAVADEGFALALELGGTITGEHGDGILRAPYVRRQFPDTYGLFKEIKDLFDPEGILNPGKILGEELRFPIERLRYNSGLPPTRTLFDSPDLRNEIEKCHGCGSCRSYCPVAQHVSTEDATARAKANLLTAVLHGEIPVGDLSSNEVKGIADLCYNCKRCLTHCPSAVDIPRLALKMKELFVETHGQSFTNWLLGNSRLLFVWGSRFPAVANVLLSHPFVRRVVEWLTGIDRRRVLPTFSRPVPLKGTKRGTKKVVYFPGCFAQYVDSEGEGLGTIRVLEANGVEVIVPDDLLCCGVAKISLGSGRKVVHDIRRNVEILAPYVEQGCPVITSAASCGLTLKREWHELLPEPRVAEVASHCFDLIEYLGILEKNGDLNTAFQPVELTLSYHNPCHLGAQGLSREPVAFLRRIPGVTVKEIEDGCSGMAGTFGMKGANFDLSMRIGRHLFDEVKRAGVSVVATGCGTCNLQVRQGTDAAVLHPAAILARAYGYPPPPRTTLPPDPGHHPDQDGRG